MTEKRKHKNNPKINSLSDLCIDKNHKRKRDKLIIIEKTLYPQKKKFDKSQSLVINNVLSIDPVEDDQSLDDDIKMVMNKARDDAKLVIYPRKANKFDSKSIQTLISPIETIIQRKQKWMNTIIRLTTLAAKIKSLEAKVQKANDTTTQTDRNLTLPPNIPIENIPEEETQVETKKSSHVDMTQLYANLITLYNQRKQLTDQLQHGETNIPLDVAIDDTLRNIRSTATYEINKLKTFVHRRTKKKGMKTYKRQEQKIRRVDDWRGLTPKAVPEESNLRDALPRIRPLIYSAPKFKEKNIRYEETLLNMYISKAQCKVSFMVERLKSLH